MLIALYPVAALFCLGFFVAVVYATRYVSVGSMAAAISLPIVLWFMQRFFHQEVPEALFQFSIFVSLLIVFTHRKNIRRLIEGRENRLGKSQTAMRA
jgi:glycerol-3-phosphate acyltransferase PlsY